MILWNRFKYVLSPQFDIYSEISKVVRGRVADIGFGTGFGTHLLSVHAKEVMAYETDVEAINFAEKVFPLPKLRFLFGDISEGIDEKHFDFITMIDCIEHLKHDHRGLENAKAMMSENGALILSTPNRLSRYRKSPEHIREYAPKELEALCRKVFVSVSMKDHRLEPLASQYQNPIIAVCRNKGN